MIASGSKGVEHVLCGHSTSLRALIPFVFTLSYLLPGGFEDFTLFLTLCSFNRIVLNGIWV